MGSGSLESVLVACVYAQGVLILLDLRTTYCLCQLLQRQAFLTESLICVSSHLVLICKCSGSLNVLIKFIFFHHFFIRV